MGNARTNARREEKDRRNVLLCEKHGAKTTWIKHGNAYACLPCAIALGLVTDKRWGMAKST